MVTVPLIPQTNYPDSTTRVVDCQRWALLRVPACSSLGLMRNLACLLLAASLCSPASAQATSVADRVAQQNALFEDFYQAGLKSSPERATSVGDYRYNAQLGDASLAEIERQHAENDAFLARLRAIPTTGMAETDRLSHELLERQLTPRRREPRAQELRDADQPAGRYPYLAGRPAAERAAGFGAALRGLHRAPPPDPARLAADHRGAARRR